MDPYRQAPNEVNSLNIHTNDNVKFKFRMIEVQEIRNAISKTKSSKCFGNDNISIYFLKLALPYIENALASLFNTSLETDTFPDS